MATGPATPGPVAMPEPSSAATIAARLLAVVSVTAAVLSFVLAVENGQSFAQLIEQHVVTPVLMGAVLAVVGAFVIAQNSRNALAWLFCAQGVLQCWSAFGAQYAVRSPDAPLAGVAAFLGAYGWAPGLLLLLCLTIPLFPDGRPAGRGWRVLLGAGIVVTVVGSLAGLCSDKPMQLQFPAFRNPFALPASWEPLLAATFDVCSALAAVLALVGVIATVVRAVRTTGRARGEALWLLGAFALGVIGQMLDAVSPVFPAVAWMLFGVALGAAMLRGGLYDGDRMLNRSLLSSAVAGVVAAAFGLTAGIIAEKLGGAAIGAVVAAIVVALALDPMRRLARRTIDRVLFGGRRDPFEAIETLGARLATAIAPDDVLTAVTETVTSALRLPAASVTLEGEDDPAASTGAMPGNTVALSLTHAGAHVGTLTVGLPGTRRFLDPQDERAAHGARAPGRRRGGRGAPEPGAAALARRGARGSRHRAQPHPPRPARRARSGPRGRLARHRRRPLSRSGGRRPSGRPARGGGRHAR